MSQVTWRASEELVARVQSAARASGASLNEFVTRVLDAATDPERADGEAARVRERLARAGLLATSTPARSRPQEAAVARARVAAGSGTTMSELVDQDR
ncbi:MAG: transcriptional regulator [Acidimicrobiales bacterium]